MKIKSLLLGMFACAALVACSNEDIVDGNGNETEVGNAVPAYISLSFTARSSADGRGVTETPAEPEGKTTNAGTENEQKVNSILYVIGTEFKYVSNVDAEFDNAAGIYTQKTPIKVAAGEHEVCVVINPCAALVTLATTQGTTAPSMLSAIKAGSYKGETTWADALDAVTKGTTIQDNFMMGNRELVKVTATDKNTQENPLVVSVNVERAVAKIMYRTTEEDNVYIVPVTTVKQTLVKKTVSDVEYTKASDQANKEVWCTLNEEGKVDKVFSIEGEVVTELVRYNGQGKTPTTDYYTLADGENLVYDHKTEKTENPVTVTLNGYALTNLQNKMYYVRHTSTNGTSGEAFGLLTGRNYLFDPYFADKSATNLDNNEFFFNSFRSYDFTASDAFEALPTDEGTESSDKKKTGGFMNYAFENAAIEAMQKHGYSTSITFKATATDKDGKLFSACVYKGNIYKEFADVEEANPGVTKAECTVYENGVCYYTAQIKHLDNGMESVMGNMEFAIVRNNIYSLSVDKLNKLGDATVDQDPTIDDETGDGYIKLAVEIMPWKVRYNNIEF